MKTLNVLTSPVLMMIKLRFLKYFTIIFERYYQLFKILDQKQILHCMITKIERNKKDHTGIYLIMNNFLERKFNQYSTFCQFSFPKDFSCVQIFSIPFLISKSHNDASKNGNCFTIFRTEVVIIHSVFSTSLSWQNPKLSSHA